MVDEIDKLIEKLKNKINDDDCFDFSLHIDCCGIKASRYKLKIKFDGCADRYFGKDGGCDCIFIFSDKVCVVECTTGKFGSRDAKRKPEQIKACYNLVRSLGYRGLIVAIFYYESFSKNISKERVELELKDIKKKDKGFIIKFRKCGKEPIA